VEARGIFPVFQRSTVNLNHCARFVFSSLALSTKPKHRVVRRSSVVDLQAAAPSPTPTRGTPRRAKDRAPPRLRALTRRRAPKRTSHVAGLKTSPHFAPSHTPTRTEENFATRPPTRAEKQLAVTPGCRPRAPDAKARGRCLENSPWNVTKPFAWVLKGALGIKLVRPGAQDCEMCSSVRVGVGSVA